MTKEKYDKVCPKCGSTNISIPPAGLDILMTVGDYCSDCNNIGVFPEMTQSSAKDFKKNLRTH